MFRVGCYHWYCKTIENITLSVICVLRDILSIFQSNTPVACIIQPWFLIFETSLWLVRLSLSRPSSCTPQSPWITPLNYVLSKQMCKDCHVIVCNSTKRRERKWFIPSNALEVGDYSEKRRKSKNDSGPWHRGSDSSLYSPAFCLLRRT